MGAKDIYENSLVENKHTFADMVNYALFRGRGIIKADELEDISPRSILPGPGKPRERIRDVVKRWKGTAINVSLVIGIENQTKSDPAMPFRMMVYDGLSYLREIEDGRPLSPVISIVYHISEKTWNAPLTVVEALGEIPEEISHLVHDYGINLVDVAALPREDVELFKDDFRFVADFLYQKVHGGKGYIPPKGYVKSVRKVVRICAEFTDDERILNTFDKLEDGEEMHSMCEWYTIMENENQAKGESKGKEEVAMNMIRMSLPEATIIAATEIPMERIRELKASIAV